MLNANNALLDALADTRRRYALSVLRDRRREMTESDLATVVASMEGGVPLIEVSEEAHRRVETDFYHRTLPKLEDAGLVRRNRNAGTVTAVDRRALESEPLAELVRDPTAVTETRERMLEQVARPRRRTVLSILEASEESMSVEELGERVAAREDDAAAEDGLKEVLVGLHHVDLPKLEDAGLLTYDADARTVTDRDHAEFDARWVRDSTFETARAELSKSSTERGDVSTIEGRENVVSYGQSMFEEAEAELFVLITTDGLLEADCVARLRDATDRGVDVYVGSQTQGVRDLVRQRVPGATIWEPQLNWLNLPPHRERLGRLVFADRESVLLGSLGEPVDRGVPGETAIAGEGENNSLVMLVRELLGGRLDHLDYQSSDFLDHLP